MTNEELAQQISELAQRMDRQFAEVRSDVSELKSDVKTLDAWLRSEVNNIVGLTKDYIDLRDRVEHLEQAAD